MASAGVEREHHTTTIVDRHVTIPGDGDRDRRVIYGDRDRRPHGYGQVQIHPQYNNRYEGGFKASGEGSQYNNRYEGGFKASGSGSFLPENGPSAGQVLAVLVGLPVGGSLLALSGLTLLATLIGLAVATPLFVIFSPVIVPAAVATALAVGAILTSGALGVTALSSFTWVANYVRQVTGRDPIDEAKRRVVDMTDYVGQKTKDLGQGIQDTAHSNISGAGDYRAHIGGGVGGGGHGGIGGEREYRGEITVEKNRRA